MTDGGPRAAVIVLAAGSGSRVGGDVNKALLPLGGIPVFAWSLQAAAQVRDVVCVVVVVSARDRDHPALTAHTGGANVDVVVGGDTRHESERRAIESLAASIEEGAVDVVVVHDAARPLARPDLYASVIAEAFDRGGAIPVRPQSAVVTADPRPTPSADWRELVAVQTPQAFRAAPLLSAYRRAEREGFTGTDTASCLEAFTDLAVVGVAGSGDNLKITYPEDLALAERLLTVRQSGAAPAAEARRRR
jgi:2-C-methyl-D-erythritol 4-phosphate cytidylyltransferase